MAHTPSGTSGHLQATLVGRRSWGGTMKIDPDKVDEAVIALLFLVSFESSGVTRAWKGHEWDALNRLHESGLISNPKGKAKSVVLTNEGKLKARRACEKLFGKTV
jgi:hypothetical protein